MPTPTFGLPALIAALKLVPPPPPPDDSAASVPFPASRLEAHIAAKVISRIEGVTYPEAIARLEADQQREEATVAAARERVRVESDEKARLEILAAMERGVPFEKAAADAGVKL